MSVSIMCVRGIVAEVSRLGYQPEQLLRAVGLDQESLSDTRTMIPAAQFESLVGHTLELTKCPSLGLMVGGVGPEFQLMTQFARALPTLRDATSMLERYAPIFVEGVVLALTESGPLASLRYEFLAHLAPRTARFCSELFSALCTRVAAETFTAGIPSVEVRFSHPEPAYIDAYRQVFRCELRFSQDENAIIFDAGLLDRKQPHADAFMAGLLGDACERMLDNTQPSTTVEQRVRAYLRNQSDLRSVDSEAIAKALQLSGRMLRRHLARESVTVTALVEQARIEAAAAELVRPDTSIKQVASKLGYSDVSSFQRAFKRWMTKTPGEYVRGEQQRRRES